MIRKISLTITSLLGLAAATGLAADKTYTFGVIAKSNNNPVFQAAKTGAEDEAAKLSKEHGVTIKIDWRTPNEEDPQKQADAVTIGQRGRQRDCHQLFGCEQIDRCDRQSRGQRGTGGHL